MAGSGACCEAGVPGPVSASDGHFPTEFRTGFSFLPSSSELKVQFIPALLPHRLAFRKDNVTVCGLLLPLLIGVLIILNLAV